MNIGEKLNMIQTEMKAPKGQFNNFAKYKFRNCEDILEAVKPFLKDLKCVIRLKDEMVLVGERYYVKATAIISDCESEDFESSEAYAREEFEKKGMDAAQLTGATSSYARKYALNGLLAIDDTKDSDTTNTHGKEPKKDSQADMPEAERVDGNKKVESAHLTWMRVQLDLLGKEETAFLTYMDIDKLEDMTLDEFVQKAKPALDKKVK
jgi:hypothetical protein